MRLALPGTLAGLVMACVSLTPVLAQEEPEKEKPSSRPSAVRFERTEDRVRVELGGEPFTEYRFAGFPFPILYPVLGPGGVHMTRHYPMLQGVEGEATDHEHHRSLWFTHGAVNGIDFWAGKGRIEQESLETDAEAGVLRARNRWVGPDGEVVCTDERVLRFGRIDGSPVLDFDVTLIADRGDVLLGDTKEGTMAIRVAPSLRLKGAVARGTIRNSEGMTDGEAWGKRARWVDYTGPVEGRVVGITLMDHDRNPRHPSWWHARDYGLLTANPFGAHDFEGAEPGTGDLELGKGERLRLRYRFWFHDGAVEPDAIEAVYRDFTGKGEDR